MTDRSLENAVENSNQAHADPHAWVRGLEGIIYEHIISKKPVGKAIAKKINKENEKIGRKVLPIDYHAVLGYLQEEHQELYEFYQHNQSYKTKKAKLRRDIKKNPLVVWSPPVGPKPPRPKSWDNNQLKGMFDLTHNYSDPKPSEQPIKRKKPTTWQRVITFHTKHAAGLKKIGLGFAATAFVVAGSYTSAKIYNQFKFDEPARASAFGSGGDGGRRTIKDRTAIRQETAYLEDTPDDRFPTPPALSSTRKAYGNEMDGTHASNHAFMWDIEGTGSRLYNLSAKYSEKAEENIVTLDLENGTTYILVDSSGKRNVKSSTKEDLDNIELEQVIERRNGIDTVHVCDETTKRLKPLFSYVTRYNNAEQTWK